MTDDGTDDDGHEFSKALLRDEAERADGNTHEIINRMQVAIAEDDDPLAVLDDDAGDE